MLLVRGRCIVNVVILSVESTPPRKESVELWEADARLDVDAARTNAVLPGGTKVLQSDPGEGGGLACALGGGCLSVVFTARGTFVTGTCLQPHRLSIFNDVLY